MYSKPCRVIASSTSSGKSPSRLLALRRNRVAVAGEPRSSTSVPQRTSNVSDAVPEGSSRAVPGNRSESCFATIISPTRPQVRLIGLRAGGLLRQGVAQAEVARRVSVSRATVSEWNAQLEAGGLAALKSRPRGRPAGLDAAQRRELMRALTGGALAEGFATDLWTLRRVAQLSERRFARPYSRSQVWRILVSLGLRP
ncbi:MAG: transposase [Gammaproteobacteria bacterium]|nr:MAG: transposase [Gammaproteobacteria bacterium]